MFFFENHPCFIHFREFNAVKLQKVTLIRILKKC